MATTAGPEGTRTQEGDSTRAVGTLFFQRWKKTLAAAAI